MSSRPRPELARYLARRFPGAVAERLAGDASTRQFYRVRRTSGPSVVVMDYGGPFESETDDVRMGRIFRAAGLPVAALLESSPAVGCLVLEDLGDRSLESILLRNGRGARGGPHPLLVLAVELAAAVAKRGTPALAASDRAGGPTLDAGRFRFEMRFFLEHYARDLRGCVAPPAELARELERLAELAADSPTRVLCHRDFHSRNLLLRDDGSLVMVDIQDARWGPDAYDLASILRDAYAPIDDAWLEPLIDLYLDRLEAPPPRDAFVRRFHVVAAQRMIKALGSFGFLSRADRQRDYLGAIPATLARLRRALPAREETRGLYGLLEAAGLLTTG